MAEQPAGIIDNRTQARKDSVGTYGVPLIGNSPSDPAWLTQNLSEQNKLPWQQYFSPAVSDTTNPDSLASRQISRGPGYYKRTSQYNVAQVPTDFHATPQTGGQVDPMADAIARKYKRDVSGKLQTMQDKSDVQSTVDYSTAQGRAGQVLGMAQQIKNKNFLEQYQFQLQRQQLQQQYENAKRQADAALTGDIINGFGGVFSLGMNAAGKK